MKTANLLINDICATLPFHLGTRVAASDLTDERIVYPKLESEEVDAVHYQANQATALQGWYLIVLPLQRLLKIDLIEEKQRKWVAVQYDRICRLVGQKHNISVERVAQIFTTTIPAFASAQPINSRHLRYVEELQTSLIYSIAQHT